MTTRLPGSHNTLELPVSEEHLITQFPMFAHTVDYTPSINSLLVDHQMVSHEKVQDSSPGCSDPQRGQ